jgi:hypothetical protein
MKALQINAPVNTTTGLQIPSGSVVVVNEFLTQQMNEKEGLIPCQTSISTYVNAASYEAGKAPVVTVSDYSSLIVCDVTTAEYSTTACEALAINEVKDILLALYPDSVIEVDVTKPLVVIEDPNANVMPDERPF